MDVGSREAALWTVVPERIWVREHPVRYAGARFLTRMTVLRRAAGPLLLHSPVPIDAITKRALDALGPVETILAPGTFHHLFVRSARDAFPRASLMGAPGLAEKRRDLAFDAVLGDGAPPGWESEIAQILVRGNPLMREVALHHVPTRTLLVVDLIENFTDASPGVDAVLRFWMRLFRLWNRPGPAPEFRFLTWDRKTLRQSARRILAWDFDRIIPGHGDIVETGGHRVASEALAWILGS